MIQPTILSSRLPSLFVTLLLVVFSLAKRKLTPLGVVVAALTALVHIAFPSPLPFAALVTFFLVGTVATRVGKVAKHGLTASAAGGAGGEETRSAVQVLANSGAADLFILLALYPCIYNVYVSGQGFDRVSAHFFSDDEHVYIFGILTAYAAAAADTLSSELGILSRASPFLITMPWKRVPRGTNGGVTLLGLGAGLVGGTSIAVLHLWQYRDTGRAAAIAVLGLGGSVLDSILGALVQATVEDKTTGRVVEGENGQRVLVSKGGSRIQRGLDVLDNNGVNFAMTASMGVAGLLVARHL